MRRSSAVPIAVQVAVFLSALAAAAVLAMLFADPVRAHEAPKGWSYPWNCCSNQDCREATGEVLERPEGYVIAGTGEVVPYGDKRVKDSPDGEYHWCAHKAGIDAGKTICLFVPPKGY